MDINKKLLALLAVFCIIASASVVCAEDLGRYAGSNYDMDIVSESPLGSSDVGDDIATDENQDGLESINDLPLENQTGYVPVNNTDNATGNTTDNTTEKIIENSTVNATGNSTNATTTNTLLTTGNPIFALMAVSCILGGYAVIKRKL